MTASKSRRQVALPDPDPSIALAQTVREEFERKVLACRPTVQPTERAKAKRAEFIAALLRRFAVRLKSLFRASAHPTSSGPFNATRGVSLKTEWFQQPHANQSRAKKISSMRRNRDAHPAD